jgi:hypothetical protein
VTNPGDRVRTAIENLSAKGQIATETFAADSESGVGPYEYLVLTTEGTRRLEQGLVES